MKTNFHLIAIMMTCISFSSAKAQLRHQAFVQHERIEQGCRHGNLNRREAHRLVIQEKHIRRDMRRARRNDGHIGPYEWKHIRREEALASRHIFRARHNGLNRF